MRGQCGPRRNAVALVETAPKILLLKQKKAVLSRCEIVSVHKPIAFINPAASFSLRVRDRFFQLRWKVNEGDVKQGRQSSLYRIFLRWSFHCWRKEAHVCSNTLNEWTGGCSDTQTFVQRNILHISQSSSARFKTLIRAASNGSGWSKGELKDGDKRKFLGNCSP